MGTEEARLERYGRQALFAPMGAAGQRLLLASRVVLLGCGATGSVIANTLARAGVGSLALVDRDFVERNNLQRQMLYDEADADARLPKAEAARTALARANREIAIEGIVADVAAGNVEELIAGA